MEKHLSSRGVLADIYSMRNFAIQLINKGKKYEKLLRLIVDKDSCNGSAQKLTSIKEIQERLGMPYIMVKKHLFEIYTDLLNHEENNIDFSLKKVEYVFSMSYFDNYATLVIKHLPVMPRIGEQMWIPYFREKVGTGSFFVDSIDYDFDDAKQSVNISLSPGTYNYFWKIRKDEAYLKGEITTDEYYLSKDNKIKKRLGYEPW